MGLDALAIGLVLAAIALGSTVAVYLRTRRQKRDELVFAENVERELHIPLSLHPVIDTDICIGSLSCITACPEGDILGIVNGTSRLVHATNCVGHGRCAAECPVGAIRLVFGSSERGVDLPEIDEYFESSRPGVHIVGELGGMGLIRNSITQGVLCADRLSKVTSREHDPDLVDVAVVGAGPAGLATALGCKKAGLSVRILEQGTMGGAVAHYPRQKVVMTEVVEVPIFGKFGKRYMNKEELVGSFQRMVQKGKLHVEEGTKVTGIEGEDGAFSLLTTRGSVPARKVVLAVGRRGTPRKLGCPGEDLPNVTSSLVDPEQYQGSRVLVVGGGDSALEAAVTLARNSDSQVVVSYRGPEFGRARAANRAQISELVTSGRVKVLFNSKVTKVDLDRVELEASGRRGVVKNDYVITALGGELPLELLKSCNVSVRRLFGESSAHGYRGAARSEADDRRIRRLNWILFSVGLAVLAGLTIVGFDYYRLSKAARAASTLNATMRPAGIWGHGVGIVATAFMMSNFLYAVRKRWTRMKSTGTIRTWLSFHMFVGFMSPLVIAFHAAFQSNNQLASLTYVSLLVVVGTGLVGRYIYGLVPGRGEKSEELADLVAQRERLMAELAPVVSSSRRPEVVQRLLALVTAPPRTGSLIMALLRYPLESASLNTQLLAVRRDVRDGVAFSTLRHDSMALLRLRTEISFYRGLKRLLSVWRLLHAGLAVFLVILICGHIGLSLFLGYRWILSG